MYYANNFHILLKKLLTSNSTNNQQRLIIFIKKVSHFRFKVSTNYFILPAEKSVKKSKKSNYIYMSIIKM